MPRDDQGSEEITKLMAKPGNARWTDRVAILAVPPSLDRSLSASAVRSGALDDRLERAVPPETLEFIRAFQPYRPDRYASRLAWLSRLRHETERT
jgi:hypothetical protein